MDVPTAGRDYTDEEIRSFVRDLESLPGGDLTVSLLVGCGERAVPPLRELLLNGKPRGVFQARQRAVEALAELGAKDVLMEYLTQKRAIADAVVRFGEEAVENTAARELAGWLTEEAFQFLMNLAERRMLPGAVYALGEFERPEAAPVFVNALGDDVSRPPADRALRAIAEKIKPLLVKAARRVTSQEDEKPSERQRRRSVVRILADMVLREEDWKELQPLLQDGDPEIEMMAGEMAVDWAPPTEKQIAARFLLRSLNSAHWFFQIRIQECLRRNYGVLHELIAHEAKVRRLAARGEPRTDPVLRILEKLQSSAKSSRAREK
jgi:HEAT repeat protein